MALNYQGFNIPEKIIIVRKEICEWTNGKSHGTGEYQGYAVPADNKSMLESALSWANCEKEWVDGERVWKDREKYITEYANGAFELSLTSAAPNSSQSGKLSFWDCTITAEDGQKYLIGINADLLCALLLNATFVNGKCASRVWLGRQKGRVGAFTETMDEFIQAKKDAELRNRKMSTKYEPGQRVFTKTGEQVYLGEMYKRFEIESIRTDSWRPSYQENIIFYDKPKKVHVYGNYAYEYKSGLRHWTRTYDLNALESVSVEDKKTNQYFNEGETFDIGSTYEEYCKIKVANLERSLARIDSWMKEPEDSQMLDRYENDKKRDVYANAFYVSQYSSSSEPMTRDEAIKALETIKNYLAYRNGSANPNAIDAFTVIYKGEILQ